MAELTQDQLEEKASVVAALGLPDDIPYITGHTDPDEYRNPRPPAEKWPTDPHRYIEMAVATDREELEILAGVIPEPRRTEILAFWLKEHGWWDEESDG